MNTTRGTLALLVALTFMGAANLNAQRRTSDGGGSSGGGSSGGGSRSAPSSGGSSGGSSAPSRGRDGGSSSAPTYSRPSSSSGNSSPSSSGSTARRGDQSASGTRTATGTTSGRPQTGKIGTIKRDAHAARNRPATTGSGVFVGACWGCNYYGWYGDQWGWYHGGWWYPAYYPPPDYYPGDGYAGGGSDGSDQGYQPYPYAGADSTNEAFAQRHASVRRSYGAVTMTYFSDAGSTTKAGQIGLEGAIGQLRGELEYARYGETVPGGKDHLSTLRLGVAAQPRIGSNAYLIAGVAARGVNLDDGSNAWGPEGELGLQAFPMRPFGLNVTERLAGLSWNGSDYFLFQELNTTGSVFINRVELQGGWHWMKVGGAPAFGGPIVGMRVWF